MEGTADIVIKKSTMIKKNERDINSVYTIEKGVHINLSFFALEIGFRVLWCSSQRYPQHYTIGKSD